jgi:uncharacterized protein
VIDWHIIIAGAIVGFTVGLTGMGGGALMTPILVIFFHIDPSSAISSDLVAAMVMKPVGGGVHIRRKTVRWELVRWLCVGSVPTAFGAVFLLHHLGDPAQIETLSKAFLGWTLVLASSAMIFKAWLQSRRSAASRRRGEVPSRGGGHIAVKIIPTVVIGTLGGTLVGLTSVGSGSIIIVCLMLIYPELRGAELVGTDLVQAVPLVGAAALAHIIVGDFEFPLFASIMIGALPTVYIGARFSTKAPDGIIRPALIFVLLASALKLLNMDTYLLAWVLLAFALVAFPLWAAVDAAAHPEALWGGSEKPREWWIRLLALGSPFVVGFVAAVGYFWKVRPELVRATHSAAAAG